MTRGRRFTTHGARFKYTVFGTGYSYTVHDLRYMLYGTLYAVHGTRYSLLGTQRYTIHDTCLHGYAAFVIGGNPIDSSGSLPSLPCIG